MSSTLMLRPNKWNEFQHYKNRRPPWVKLHHSLLDDRDFQRLPIASRALAPMLWLLSSESEDGSFSASIEELVFRLRQPAKDIETGLRPLIDVGFFVEVQHASTVLATRLQLAVPEESKEEKETNEFFSMFWSAYPKKTAKPAAVKAFKSAKINGTLNAVVLKDIECRKSTHDWKTENGKFVPNPATYLNQRRWEDEAGSARQEVPTPWAGAR
jgi:hypothetical protein